MAVVGLSYLEFIFCVVFSTFPSFFVLLL